MKPIDSIIVTRIDLKGVPCLLVRPKDYKYGLPTLFHYHGWGSRKENHVFFAKIIAQFGFQVILPDSKYHGDRIALKDYSLENINEYFWEIVTQSVKEFQEIKDYTVKKYKINSDLIAVSGNSMGGYISSSIFAQDSSIKSLVCFIGGCAWIESEKIRKEKFGLHLSKKIDLEQAKIFDPITYKDKLYPRPILMLHGNMDNVVPIEIQEYFYKEIFPYYKERPENLRLEIYPDVMHQVSFRMVESAAKFLDEYMNL